MIAWHLASGAGIVLVLVLVGVLLLGFAYLVAQRFAPGALHRAWQERNAAVAIVAGSVVAGLAWIIATVIHG